jgi:hypothetical protein
LKNFYLNIKGLGCSAIKCPAFLLKHPSERLFAVFPLLLKPFLNHRERCILKNLEGCEAKLDEGIDKFYKLREKFL